MIGELIGREALRIERAETGFIAEKRAASHGHTTREKDVNGGVQPNDRNPGVAEKFRGARLRVGAAPESDNGGLMEFRSPAESGSELICFQLTEGRLTMAFEELGDADAGGGFDAFVEVDEVPAEMAG